MNKKFKIGMYSAVVLFFLIGIFLFNRNLVNKVKRGYKK